MTPMPPAKIAIVDDDPPISELISDVLEDAGFHPFVCAHGPEAYSCIREGRPRVILLDVHLAGLNGVAVYHALQHDLVTADIPVIFITGDPARLKKLLPNYQQRGAKVLSKPFDLDELTSTIRDTLAACPPFGT